MPASLTPDTLRRFEVFAGLPDEVLQWIIDHGEVLETQEGNHVVEKGAKAQEMLVVLEGALEFRYTLNGQMVTSGEQPPGAVTGLLPYSRMTHYQGDVVALQPSRVLRVDKTHFADMLHQSMELGRRLVAIMSDRVRRSTKNAQQREKLIALGKLAAGLAHELNNPAAAIRRTTDALHDRLAQLATLATRLVSLGVTEAQLCAADSLREAVLTRPSPTLSPLQRSEHEDAVTDWLEEYHMGEAWKLAETLVDVGLTLDDLDQLARDLPEQALPGVLAWLEAGLAADRLLSEITDASARVSELVASVKAYSHMDRNPDKQPVDVQKGIDNTLTMLGHKLKRKAIAVDRAYAEDLPNIPGYPGELNQVWTNLIDNAIDALPDEGGRLRIEIRPQKTYLCIRIVDNGHGIPADIQERVFEPFFTTKDVGEGTGLGLDVVQRIVREHHGGDLTVASEDGHTVFEVRLPR